MTRKRVRTGRALRTPFVHSWVKPNSCHYSLLRRESPFPQLARVLRVSSPRQLGLTSIFELAKRDLAALFPGGPIPFGHLHLTEDLEEALELALQYDADLEVVLTRSRGGTNVVNLPSPRRPRKRCFTVSSRRPTLTQRASMIPLVQIVMMTH